MDLVEIGLKGSYILLIIGIVAALFMPLIQAITSNPKSLAKGAMGLGFIVVVYLIGYAMSGNEVTSSYIEFGVDAGLSKSVGGLINAMYLLMGLALAGILYTEVSKLVR